MTSLASAEDSSVPTAYVTRLSQEPTEGGVLDAVKKSTLAPVGSQ